MAFCRHWLLILCALVLGAQMCDASTREERTYAAAMASFQTEMWSRAEGAFGQFAQRFPKSTNAPMAVLLEAQAQFKQGKYTNAIALLTDHKTRADGLADQYVSWTGEAQFAGSNYLAAADTYASLIRDFPESPLRLRAAIEAASAYDQGGDWQQVIDFLSQTNGVFQQKAEQDPENALVSSGCLLMANAYTRLGDTQNSHTILSAVNTNSITLTQAYQYNTIRYDNALTNNDANDALQAATNLQQIAGQMKDSAVAADAGARMAGALTLGDQPAQAMAAWGGNLTTNAPAEKQREAILKMAALAAGQQQFSDAEQWLETYLKQFPDAPEADIALLTDGELHLNDHTLQVATNNIAAVTNDLPAAQGQFDLLLSKFPASPYAGKAYLDRGWCKWLANDFSDSLADFEKAAAQKGLSPVDLAVAKFKAGDILFAQTNFAGALENYRSVFPEAALDEASGRPSAERNLRGRALYQCLRACLELNDVDGAADAFTKLSQTISSDELGQSGALLYGESLAKPEDARALFEKLAPRFTGSPLEPDLKLAIARTYEQEQDWAAAVTNYGGWVLDFPTNSLRPQVDYALAQANYQAGNEDDALALFTHFVAQYPTNALAPQAQWWVAEHFFRAGEYDGAETNYEAVFQNPAWKTSPLYYPAQLMAGNAAMNRANYKEAGGYFMALINDTNCPDDKDDNIWVKARFAYGAALMLTQSSDTNAMAANLQNAINTVFSQITQKYPTNELGAQAWGEIGDCNLQLDDYVSATNAYARVFGTNSPAGISTRSEAQVGYGLVLEKMAAQATGTDQTNLLSQALDNYMDVFNAVNQRDDETADAYWVKEAGLKAAPLVGLFYGANAQKKFYDSLQANLPALAEAIQKKIAALPPEKN